MLPYPVGASHIVTLSHCGGSYHGEGQPDDYAIDYSMDIGTPISAIRAGRAIFVEEPGIDGNFPKNLVIVKHNDGKYAQYMHLKQGGAMVNVSDEIVQGRLIGLSGNTGLAGYPHLHFVLTKNIDYPYISISTTFKNTLPNEKSLVVTMKYPAYYY